MNESEVVFASNAAQRLTDLVCDYLEICRVHDTSLRFIPKGPFTVVFIPMNKEGFLSVRLVHTKTRSWSTPTYYSPDSESFSEAWGSCNISGSESHSAITTEEQDILIPFAHLALSRQEIVAIIKSNADKKQKAEQDRQKAIEINRLENELAKLKGASV